MRVLQICHKPPYPAVDGGCIATAAITEGFLQNRVELKVVTIETHKHPFLPDQVPAEILKATQMEAAFADTAINVVDAMSALLTRDNYNVSRFFSPDMNQLLQRVLSENEYDVVHLESLFVTPYIPTIRKWAPKSKVVLRSHNLEHTIWRRLKKGTRNPAKKLYLSHIAHDLQKYEEEIGSELDAVLAISPEDKNRYLDLGCPCPVEWVPFGLEAPAQAQDVLEARADICHLGAMDWEPNLEGVHWFIQEVWPEVKKANPDLEFHMAGRKTPSYFENYRDLGVVSHGEVDSAMDFINGFQMVVVPLLSGGGMRIKIIEAMAAGRVVISTSVGAEGILGDHGQHFMIADTPEEFAKAIESLLSDPSMVERISRNAMQLVNEHYIQEDISKRLVELYRNMCV